MIVRPIAVSAKLKNRNIINETAQSGSIPLCLIDGGGAYIRSGGAENFVEFMLRINIIAWGRFGNLCLKELHTWYSTGHVDAELVGVYLGSL